MIIYNLKKILIPILCFMQLFIIVGCTPYSSKVYNRQKGSVEPNRSVATILLKNTVDWFSSTDIHFEHKNYGSVLLPAGTHTLEWGTEFAISVLIKRSGSDHRSWRTTICLEPGHTYSIYSDRTTGYGYQVFSWIIDETINEIVWGIKMQKTKNAKMESDLPLKGKSREKTPLPKKNFHFS